MSGNILRVHHAGVTVRSLKDSVAWYQKNLGFEYQYEFGFPGARAVMLVRGDARIELFQVEGSRPMEAERQNGESNLRFGGIHHFALTVDDIDTFIDALKSTGVKIVMAPTDVPNDSGDRFAFIHDNDNMLIEIIQPAA